MVKYDLHCHSTCSDGDLSPVALIALAAEREITHLALTDHDTLAGLDEARAAADEKGVSLINGIELSCTWRGQLLHIVGLGVDPENPTLQAGVAANQRRRVDRASKMFDDFRRVGIELEGEVRGLLNGAVPTRPHFAQALINLSLVKDKKQAFKKYLVRGKPGFVPLVWPDLEEIATWIKAAGGEAVLAHPMRYKLTRTKLVTLIGEMKAVGIRGIEVSTPVNDRAQIDMLAKLAAEHELLASMGSDFHSPDQPWARLGSAQALPDNITPVWQAL